MKTKQVRVPDTMLILVHNLRDSYRILKSPEDQATAHKLALAIAYQFIFISQPGAFLAFLAHCSSWDGRRY